MILHPDKIYHELIAAGEDWADKHAAAYLLEETKKSVLASLMNASTEKSVAAKEMEALAHIAYDQHLDRMVEAGRQRDRARVKYDSLKTLAELRRSQESSKRAEMNLR